jgi:CBS domain containing-hemolysin-like protein
MTTFKRKINRNNRSRDEEEMIRNIKKLKRKLIKKSAIPRQNQKSIKMNNIGDEYNEKES